MATRSYPFIFINRAEHLFSPIMLWSIICMYVSTWSSLERTKYTFPRFFVVFVFLFIRAWNILDDKCSETERL